jgi:hypothetical protein
MNSADDGRMDTYEARTRMRDLALEAQRIIEAQARGEPLPARDGSTLRQLASEARGLLADAGYPGEGVWRGLQRATIGMETGFDREDRTFWRELAADLRMSIDTLDSLVAPRGREADVHIIG